MAWLKSIRLCPGLSYFPGFLVILKAWLFFENRGTNLTAKQSNIKPGLHVSSKDRKHRLKNMFFKLSSYGL